MGRHGRQVAIGGGLILIALGLAYGASQIASAAGYAGVGPNFVPWVVTVALGLCGVLLLREALTGGFRQMEDAPAEGERGDWVNFAWVSAGILANAALITTVGFILSCTLCFVLAVRGFKASEGRGASLASIAKDTATGLAIAAPVYWMFTKLLAINLPGLTETGWI